MNDDKLEAVAAQAPSGWKLWDNAECMKRLEEFCAGFEFAKDAARRLEISAQYLGDMRCGVRPVSEAVLSQLFIEKAIFMRYQTTGDAAHKAQPVADVRGMVEALDFKFNVTDAALDKEPRLQQTIYLDGQPALYINLSHPRFYEVQAALASARHAKVNNESK